MTLIKYVKSIIILSFLLFTNAYSQPVIQEKMTAILSMVGEWDLTQYTYGENGEWDKTSTSEINMVSGLSSVMISGDTQNTMPKGSMDLQLSITYDQFREIYRMSVIDSIYGLMDIYEGNMESGGHLVLTNIKSDTHFPIEDGVMHFRFTFNDDDKEKITFSIDQTSDRGENWSPMLNYVMKKK